jgi:hypothetical protein
MTRCACVAPLVWMARSLAHDLGRALGTYAHLTALRREASGPYRVQVGGNGVCRGAS